MESHHFVYRGLGNCLRCCSPGLLNVNLDHTAEHILRQFLALGGIGQVMEQYGVIAKCIRIFCLPLAP